jgi:hypothetical protein
MIDAFNVSQLDLYLGLSRERTVHYGGVYYLVCIAAAYLQLYKWYAHGLQLYSVSCECWSNYELC